MAHVSEFQLTKNPAALLQQSSFGRETVLIPRTGFWRSYLRHAKVRDASGW